MKAETPERIRGEEIAFAGATAAGPPDARVSTSVSLVLPMFNEAPCVDATLSRAVDILERWFADFEIVVADDASTDGCVQQVEAWMRRDNRIKLVRLPRNQRFGGALRAASERRRRKFFFTLTSICRSI